MGIFDAIRRSVRKKSVLKNTEMLSHLPVSAIMTKYVITISPNAEIIAAATKMVAEDISCLIVTEAEKAAGVLSERDFLLKVPMNKSVFTMKVQDVMSPGPFTIPPTTSLPEAVAMMKQKGFRRLVVADHGKLVGVVTQTDFTRTVSKLFSAYPVMPELTVGHIMTKSVIAVSPKSTVAEAKQKMLKANVGAIIIMDGKSVAGIFTEYDVVMQFYDQRGKLMMNEISKYMRKYVRAVTPDTSIFAANKLMLEKNMRRLLVVEGDQVVGILTQTDICRYLYTNIPLIAKGANDKKYQLKRFSVTSEIHGEFRGEHLKVYNVE